jgi:uncharacterized protein (DUF924 family)
MTAEAGGGARAIGAPGTSAEDVLAFWRVAGPDRWFSKDAAFDSEIATRFFAVWHAAAEGLLATWEDTAAGALALTIVLDQFPRNMFRGHARAFESDPVARAVADRALARGFDRQVAHDLRQFFYLPFEHSEHMADQERSLELARRHGDAEYARYAEQHADIIRRFGRFPHRNAALGRVTTPEEQAFIDGGGFSG